MLADNAKKLAGISKSLGAGGFDVEITPRSKKDTLGYALIEMRTNLKDLDENNKR